MEHSYARLHIWCFGIAAGLIWAAYLLGLGFAADMTGYGHELIRTFGFIYIGYGPSVKGSLIGAAWGFLDGFIGSLVFAWIYNALCTLFSK
ncbi:MAG: bacteriophage holin [Pseudomonadota bacterium]|nr:bacteriophage holin [Gammaproteobacteria bacterium]MBU1628631.1 bacteriophage holin [Gammaproteobacteria bacterium]MBU1926962.1 bacteriophage holin [Gammaproteobacteria bacterium]MBU2546606.1 bacteriophage holin [Gammaproteobacteria bacterium]